MPLATIYRQRMRAMALTSLRLEIAKARVLRALSVMHMT